ncbi:MAG: hypothetical protein RIS85_1059 [Pseudomonadota bacterium]
MAGTHPVLALAACGMYLGVAVACGFAARNAMSHGSRKFWILSGVFFVALTILRGTGIEIAITDALRAQLYQDGAYESRREFQRPLAAAAFVLICAALYLFYLKRPAPRAGPRGWARFWALIGITVMLGVILMRLISFHELDRLLYGPVRMNWVLDIGSALLVAASAVVFGRHRDKAAPKRPTAG